MRWCASTLRRLPQPSQTGCVWRYQRSALGSRRRFRFAKGRASLNQPPSTLSFAIGSFQRDAREALDLLHAPEELVRELLGHLGRHPDPGDRLLAEVDHHRLVLDADRKAQLAAIVGAELPAREL